MKVKSVPKINAAMRLLASTYVEAMPQSLVPEDHGIEGVVMWASEGIYQGKKLVHGPRIKVSNIKGKFDNNDNFSLTLAGKIVAGHSKLTNKETRRCVEFVRKNAEVIKEYWDNPLMSAARFVLKLEKV